MRPLALGLALAALPASADSLQIHLQSDHAGGCETCNERNLGIGWRGKGDIAPIAGYYVNSWGKDSFYGGANFRIIGGISVTMGGVTGYDNITNGEILPLPMAHWVVLPNSRFSPMFTYAPSTDGGVGLLSINIKMD